MTQLEMDGPVENPVWMPKEWIVGRGMIGAGDPRIGAKRWQVAKPQHAKCEDCLRCILQWLDEWPRSIAAPGLARRATWEREWMGVTTLHCEGHMRLRVTSDNGGSDQSSGRPSPGFNHGRPTHDPVPDTGTSPPL